MAKITGFGGIFFKSPNPKALIAWYRETLGLAVEDWGGAMLNADGSGPPLVVWSPFAMETTKFAPSKRDFMFNFAVDDLEGFAKDLEAKGVTVMERLDGGEMGLFAAIVDLDGNKIELWQPK